MGAMTKCRIEVIGEMTQERHAAFVMLYYPLIGQDAAILYSTMVAIGTRNQKIRNHLLIEKISGLSKEVIEKNRHILEQYLLVKTYYRAVDDQYVYQVFMPKEGNTFLRHEVFGRLYLKQMGKQVYEFNKLCFAHDLEDKEEYQEITMPFENIIKDQWKDSEEENFQKLKPDEDDMQRMSDIPLSFNYDRFLTGYSKTLFPLTCRNQKNLRLIGELATIHGISEMDMRKYVSQSMNLKDNTLNAELLKRKVRNAKRSVMVDLDVKNPYALPPVRFLQSKQHGVEVSRSDAYLIETLITDFKMKPEVVNVLIEYVLEKTNQRFSKSYVEKIASVWVRLNIDTSEKALAHIKEEEQKPIKTKKKELPEWFQQEDEGSEKANKTVDDKELEEMMERLRGE